MAAVQDVLCFLLPFLLLPLRTCSFFLSASIKPLVVVRWKRRRVAHLISTTAKTLFIAPQKTDLLFLCCTSREWIPFIFANARVLPDDVLPQERCGSLLAISANALFNARLKFSGNTSNIV
jgi:hypothetical protein